MRRRKRAFGRRRAAQHVAAATLHFQPRIPPTQIRGRKMTISTNLKKPLHRMARDNALHRTVRARMPEVENLPSSTIKTHYISPYTKVGRLKWAFPLGTAHHHAWNRVKKRRATTYLTLPADAGTTSAHALKCAFWTTKGANTHLGNLVVRDCNTQRPHTPKGEKRRLGKQAIRD